MTAGKIVLIIALALTFAAGPIARAALSQEQAYSLFSQANEAFSCFKYMLSHKSFSFIS